MLLVAVFFVAELMPIYRTLDLRLLAMLSVEDYTPFVSLPVVSGLSMVGASEGAAAAVAAAAKGRSIPRGTILSS